VGKVNEEKLAKLEDTVGELRSLERTNLEREFGAYGLRLTNLREESMRTKSYRSSPTKSISLKATFQEDILLADIELMISHRAAQLRAASWKKSRQAQTISTEDERIHDRHSQLHA